MHTDPPRLNQCGQAMIELIVALVAILAITVGLLQLATLGRTQTEVMVQARQEAGSLALNPLAGHDSADYILDCLPGPDTRRLTADDVIVDGDPGAFNDAIVDHAAGSADQWSVLAGASRTALPELRNHPDPASVFGLVHGEESETVPLLSAFQRLLYHAREIEIEGNVWMTHTGNIY